MSVFGVQEKRKKKSPEPTPTHFVLWSAGGVRESQNLRNLFCG
jgi:hypothetical protein